MWHFGKIRGVGGVEAVLGKYECVDAQSAPPRPLTPASILIAPKRLAYCAIYSIKLHTHNELHTYIAYV